MTDDSKSTHRRPWQEHASGDRQPRNRHPYRRPARQSRFVRAMFERGVVTFGDFTLKSGRRSPYFLNLGLVADADGLAILGGVFAAEVRRLPTRPEVLFGPAYKGIAIAVSAALALARDEFAAVGVAYNRKEEKAHGEGGALVGAPVVGKKVVIVDDVVTDGAVKRQAFDMLTDAGAEVVGVVLAFDRQEPVDSAPNSPGAVQALQRDFRVPVRCVANVDDLLNHMRNDDRYAAAGVRLRDYRRSLRT